MNEALLGFLKSYEIYLNSAQSISVAVFGACSFIILRQLGILPNDGALRSRGNWMLVLAGVLSIITIVSSFLAMGAVQSMFSDAYKADYLFDISNPVDPEEHDEVLLQYMCKSSIDGQLIKPDQPGHYFDECIRGPTISPIVRVSIVTTLISLFLVIGWFLYQLTPFRKERNAID